MIVRTLMSQFNHYYINWDAVVCTDADRGFEGNDA
jgi:hypothetical protein